MISSLSDRSILELLSQALNDAGINTRGKIVGACLIAAVALPIILSFSMMMFAIYVAAGVLMGIAAIGIIGYHTFKGQPSEGIDYINGLVEKVKTKLQRT